MSINLIAFLVFLFGGMTILNRVTEGVLMTSADMTVMENLMIFRTQSFGPLSVPLPNMNFFTDGIPHLVKWDYSYFSGTAGIIPFFLYALSAAVCFMIFTYAVGMVSSYILRR